MNPTPLTILPIRETPLAPATLTGMIQPEEAVAMDNTADVAARLRQIRQSRMTSPGVSSPQGFEARSQRGLENLKKELGDFGYHPKEKILTHRDNLAYLKCVNKFGHTCFIEIDDDRAIIGINPRDLAAYEAQTASVIPLSTKMGNLDCAGSDIAGVALVCEGSVCMITRKGTGEPVERTFIYGEAHNNRAMRFDGSPMAFPVVRLSEIRAHNDLVCKCVAEATARIRRAAREDARIQFQQTCEAIKDLHEKFAKAAKMFDAYMCHLEKDLRQLEEFNCYYLEHPPCDDKAAANHCEIKDCIHRHNDLITDELRAVCQLNEERAHIIQVCADSKRIIDYMSKSFIDLKGGVC